MAIKLYYYYYHIYNIYIIWYVKNVNTYQIFYNNKGANTAAIQASYPLSSIIVEGVLSGNGLSRRNCVWRGFCPRGFCPEMAYV